jgi:arylsulfatase A-like enzyme
MSISRLFTLVAGLTLLLSASAAAAEKPNIVVILADDLGYGDISAYNEQSRIETQHIDQLAEQGTRFTDAHAPASWCTPTRYGLLTGRYPSRSDRIRQWRQKPVIQEGRLTLPAMLKQAGYTTGMVGKWHLGFENGDDFKYDEPIRGGPVDRGFDYYYGIYTSLDFSPYFYIKNRQTVAAPTKTIEERRSEKPHWNNIQGPFYRGGKIAPGFRIRGVLPRLREKAVGYIERQRRQQDDQPFFLYLALTAPHTPWLPLEEYQGESDVGMYGDFMLQVDSLVGDVTKTIERLGLAEDTLVIFTSDNGPLWYDKDVAKFGHDSAEPWRGMKGDAWEGGHRVPFIVRWPGHVPADAVSDQLLSFTDLMASFGELVGQPIPEGQAPDSQNVLPALLGETEGPLRQRMLLGDPNPPVSLRSGKWKYIPHRWSGGFTPRPSKQKLKQLPPAQLYNLEEDPGEQNNLYKERPEKVKEMKQQLKKLRQEG